METSSPESRTQQNQNSGKPKRKYWRFIFGFLGIIVIIGGGFFVWERYLSPQAKSNRETQKNYEKYLAWEENYKKAMTEDTYGGKTPEETLKMFIEALKKDDIELASRYFQLETNTQDPDYLTRNKIIKALKKEKEEGNLQHIVEIILKAVPDPSEPLYNRDYGFVVYEKGTIITEINMELNKYSSVWKIQSL